MASRFFFIRNLKRPIFFYNMELESKMCKSLYFDFSQSRSIFIRFKLHLNLSLKSSLKTKIRPYCICTGKSRSVDKDFSFSRFSIKSTITKGSVTGYKKSSW